MASTATIIIQAVDKVSKVLDGIGKQGENLASKLKSGFRSIGEAGRVFTEIGAVGTAAFGLIVNEAAKFESALKNTMTMTGLQGQALADMEQKMGGYALELADKFGISGEQINTAFYQVLSSGSEAGTEQFNALTETALKMNKVVGIDLSDAVEQTSDSLHAFGMDVSQAGKMADVFFKATRLGSTNLPQLMEAMRTAAPTAKAFGVSLEETSAVLTMWASKGTKGAEAGTAFRQVLLRLVTPEVKSYLDSIGVSVYDATGKFRGFTPVISDIKNAMAGMTEEQQQLTLKTVAGQHAFARFGALLQADIPTIQNWTEQLKNADGELDKAFNNIMKGFSEQVKVLGERLKTLVTIIGNQLLPVLTPVVTKISDVVSGIIKWVSHNEEIARWIVLVGGIGSILAVVAGTVLMFVGAVGGMVAGLVAGAAAIPAIISALAPFAPLILGIVAAVGLVVAAVVALAVAWFNNWGGIQEKTKIVVDYIMQAWGAFSKWIIAAWNAIWKEVGPVVKEITDFILEAWNDVVTELTPILSDLWVMIQKGWKDFQPVLEQLLILFEGQIVSFAHNTALEMKTWLEIFKNIWAMVKVLYETVIKPAFIAIGQIISTVFDQSKTPIEKFKGVLQALVQFMSTIGKAIVSALYNAMAKEWLNFQNWYNQKFGELQGMIAAMTGLTGQVNNAGGGNKVNITTTATTGGSTGTRSVSPAILSSNVSNSSAITINLGTLIGDDSSLRNLSTKLTKFQLETAGRMA